MHPGQGRGLHFLDLHGLHVAEAVAATEARLGELAALSASTAAAASAAPASAAAAEECGGGGGSVGAHKEQTLELIPGAGRHSADGRAHVKPAVEALLRARPGVRFEERSAGSWDVWVSPP